MKFALAESITLHNIFNHEVKYPVLFQAEAMKSPGVFTLLGGPDTTVPETSEASQSESGRESDTSSAITIDLDDVHNSSDEFLVRK